MKPISVRFKCFGPYMDEQFIDFGQLQQNGLFLICGETGAGKTTILDAICYALYCESSGGLRGDIEAMRCKLAEKTDETEVEFIFDSNGCRYKFTRAMKYKTKNLHKYHTCYRLNGESWEVLESDMKSVTARAEALVGLTSSQFRQVIILPQGKFEEFLVSDSKKKEEILVTLFDVQQWSRICEEISRRVNARSAQLEREKAGIAGGFRRYGCDGPEALAKKQAALADSLETLKVQAANAAKALEEAEAAYASGKQDDAAFTEFKKRQARFNSLKSREAEMAQEEQLLKNADAAERLRPVYGEYSAALAAKRRAEAAVETAAQAQERAKAQLQQSRAALDKHEALLPEQNERNNKLLLLEHAREVYASLSLLRSGLKQAVDALEAAEKAYQRAADSLEEKEAALVQAFAEQDAAREAYDDAQIRYRLGIGGILARTLQSGKPCPVCGSTSHPAPAEQSETSVSENQLDKLNKALTRCARAVSAAVKERAQAEKARNEAQQKLDAARQSLVLAQSRVDTAAEKKIPGIETEAQLEREKHSLATAAADYERQGKQFRDGLTHAEASAKAAEMTRTEAQQALAAAQSLWTAQQSLWQAALEASCFDSGQAFLDSCLEPGEKQRRYQLLAHWKADIRSAEASLQEQSTLLSGREAPDLKTLKLLRDAADQESRRLSEKKILDEKALKDIRSDEKKLASRLEIYREAMAKLEADQVFARRLSGSHGVGLQRYVLGVMMNSIAAQANRLLEHVYGGRYRLFRTDEASGRTLKGGLELEVYDSHNSQRRSVRTLSGGEKFLVALSLAIGLSTVVQAQGDGIRLEAMFIDEGFGSLDREAISDALEILQGIRRSAGVVGIISHVELLAETIPTRIEITKGKNGSVCRVVQ